MPEEKEKTVHPACSSESEGDVRSHPETNFLPPLKMVLAFLDRNKTEKGAKRDASDEKNVERLIEKLSEKDE